MAVSTPPEADAELLSRWVREHSRAVRGFVLGLVRKQDVADDILQEVFQRAWQARGTYQEQGRERAYLLRIADRLVCDRGRRKGVEQTVDEAAWQQLEPAADEDEPLATLTSGEVRGEVAAALDRLSPPQRRVLLLRYFGDCDFAEIARTMEIPLNTALSHCRRGLATLRKLLTEETP
ncbi:MAG: RNA polymerase sigma factor [Pirellulaceae bacterium]|nr:RNA polymerase sigma factor [Pirellulaceae bacterium]